MSAFPRTATVVALALLASCDDPGGSSLGPPTGGEAGSWVELTAPALPGPGPVQELELATGAADRLHLAVRTGGLVHVFARDGASWTHLGGTAVTDLTTARMAFAHAGARPVVASLTAAGELRVDVFQGGVWLPLGNMPGDLGAFPAVSAASPELHLAAGDSDVFIAYVDEAGVLAIRHFSFVTGGWIQVGTPGDEIGTLFGSGSPGDRTGLTLGGAGPVLVYRTAADRSAAARLQGEAWAVLATLPEGHVLGDAHGRTGPDGRGWIAATVAAPTGTAGRLFSAGATGLSEPVAGAFATALVPRRARVAFEGAVPVVGFQVHGPADHPRRDEVVVRRAVGAQWVELGAPGPGAGEPGLFGFAVSGLRPHVALTAEGLVRVFRFEPE